MGFHIIGPHTPMVIQEVIDLMANQGMIEWIYRRTHIRPAKSKLILSTLNNLREPF